MLVEQVEEREVARLGEHSVGPSCALLLVLRARVYADEAQPVEGDNAVVVVEVAAVT